MAISVPLRHELKFFITPMEYEILSRALKHTLWKDPNGDENNEYHIRSLYFDTIFNDALFDKLDGVQNRNKYRIRIYNLKDKLIKLECKTKVGSLISKRSLTIPRDLADQLIADQDGIPLSAWRKEDSLHRYDAAPRRHKRIGRSRRFSQSVNLRERIQPKQEQSYIYQCLTHTIICF